MSELTYKERLDKINDMSDTVWNSIDKPMRRLIFEMNRTGLITCFSCFGIPYGEDDEPKTHAKDNCYVHFYITKKGLETLDKITKGPIVKSMLDSRQIIIFKFSHGKFCLGFRDILPDEFYMKDSTGYSIHKYEAYIIAINVLCQVFENIRGKRTVEIIDGNESYQHIEYWQVKSKPRFKISTKEFYDTYGKVERGMKYIKDFIQKYKPLKYDEVVDKSWCLN